jgi:hypothetical protein
MTRERPVRICEGGEVRLLSATRPSSRAFLCLRLVRLQALLARAKSDLLRFSESFPDADALLAKCWRRGLCAVKVRQA